MKKAQKISEEIIEFTDAKSVFLYGSRARADFYSDSDYGVGVLMEKRPDIFISRKSGHFYFLFTYSKPLLAFY